MKTPITPEALIELGFKESKKHYLLFIKHNNILITQKMNVCFNGSQTNATTIEDIKDLIRLFK